MAQKIKVAAGVMFAVFLLSSCGAADPLGDRYTGFAQCLTDRGVTMYGAYWCPHCANQKKRFGVEGFKPVKYVECDPKGANANPELCAKKGIQGFPTWIFADGTRVEREMELDELGTITKCTLPAVPQADVVATAPSDVDRAGTSSPAAKQE